MMNKKARLIFPSGATLEIFQGDITLEDTDAIVNAANAQLVHGGGVAAAIARRGGEAIWHESREWVRQNGPVSHDRPAYTTGGNLRCKVVIHAVGPIWGEGDEADKLAQAITGSLDMAARLGLRSIAFPAISTGIFGFPVEKAAQVFCDTLNSYFSDGKESPLNLVRLVLFDETTTAVFQNIFQCLPDGKNKR